MVPIILAFQRAIYNVAIGEKNGNVSPILPTDAGLLWYLRNLGIVAVASVVLLYFAMAIFRRVEGNFAEEL